MRKLTVDGNLSAEPELKFLGEKDTPLLEFAIISSENRWVKGSKVEDKIFVNVKIWGNRGQSLATHLSKGSKVFLCGDYITETYEKDGQTRTKFYLENPEFAFGDSKKTDKPKDSSEKSGGDNSDDLENPF